MQKQPTKKLEEFQQQQQEEEEQVDEVDERIAKKPKLQQQEGESLNPREAIARGDARISFDSELNTFVQAGEPRLVWDDEKKAWFPELDAELMAQQQSIYGNPTTLPVKKRARPKGQPPLKPKDNAPQTTVQLSQSSIYVSNLPPDVTAPELGTYFAKCGLIMTDVRTGKPRIKVYTDETTGVPKGDALLSFFKPESVQLAITLLDETELRPGCVIRVEKATFEEKKTAEQLAGEAPQSAMARRAEKRKLEQAIKNLERQLDWADDDDPDSPEAKRREKAQRTVVLKYMFTPKEMDQDPGLLLDLKEDVREECEKWGEVTLVTVFDRHPDGVITVRFKEKLAVTACIQVMHGRYFGGRRIAATVYDGETQFGNVQEQESEEQQQKRLERYSKWLESGGEGPMPEMLDPQREKEFGVGVGVGVEEQQQQLGLEEQLEEEQHKGEQDGDEGEVPVHGFGEGIFFTATGQRVSGRQVDQQGKLREDEELYFEDEEDEEEDEG